MNLTVNGKAHDHTGGDTLGSLLASLGMAGRPVVVELNGMALTPGEQPSCPLEDGDRIEIVEIAAGG